MRIVVIGGLERAEQHFERLALEAGHEVFFHDGRTGGRGARALVQLVDRCEVVVVLTDVNSHGAVQLARRLLKENGRTPLLLRRLSIARFGALLDALSLRERAGFSRLAAVS